MDGGIDDALALILALRSEELEVAGITAVSGNVSVDQAAINALRVVQLLNRRNVWVAKGLANPLVRDPIRATRYHGKDGLGDSNLPLPKLKPHEKTALDLLSEEVASATKRELSIIATGPLTNIAAMFTKDPESAGKIRELSIMGGAYSLTPYGVGNETPVAEFNIYSDPEAAKIVLESGTRLKAVGLDVTMIPDAQLSIRDYSIIRETRSKVASFASKILARAMRQKLKHFALHDPMAVAVVARPSLFKFEKLPVVVETRGEYTSGMTVTYRRHGSEKATLPANVTICKSLKAGDFKRMVIAALTSDLRLKRSR
jgi:inosine-uridine nucleoside N-ribohydrolase